jgi:hypothetical protein
MTEVVTIQGVEHTIETERSSQVGDGYWTRVTPALSSRRDTEVLRSACTTYIPELSGVDYTGIFITDRYAGELVGQEIPVAESAVEQRIAHLLRPEAVVELS